MNSESIRKLRRSFIGIVTISLLIVMAVIAMIFNLANYYATRRIVTTTISQIIDNDGELPDKKVNEKPSGRDRKSGLDFYDSGSLFDNYSPEYHYSTRYFSVILNKDGSSVNINLNHIVTYDADDAVDFAKNAIRCYGDQLDDSNIVFRKAGNYYYGLHRLDKSNTIVVLLDTTAMVKANTRSLCLTLITLAFCMVIMFILVVILSKRAIKPEIENVQRQKVFITNASHELKTPLAVIRANTEMCEMMGEQNEWTESTMRQVDRMQSLIEDLVMLTKSSEFTEPTAHEDTDISRIVADSVKEFDSLVQKDGKSLSSDVPEGIHMSADSSQIQKLSGILLDNAIKYCDDKGHIDVSLSQDRRGTYLRVSNSYTTDSKVNTDMFFERFYRADESHNQKKDGFGIGLSMAESICRQHGGSIKATYRDDVITFTCVLKK